MITVARRGPRTAERTEDGREAYSIRGKLSPRMRIQPLVNLICVFACEGVVDTSYRSNNLNRRYGWGTKKGAEDSEVIHVRRLCSQSVYEEGLGQ